MAVVGRLKDGELSITGEIDERLPAVRNGLVVHFPFDGTLRSASLWGGWTDSRSATGKVQDIYMSHYPTSPGTKLVFCGEFRKHGLDSNDFWFFAYQYNTTTEAWLWQSAVFDCNFPDDVWVYREAQVTIGGNPGDQFSNWSQGISIRNTVTTGTLEWRNCHCYVIEDGINYIASNVTLTDHGIGIDDPTTNTWTGEFSVYNNYTVPASITRLDETYMGQPVYRVAMTVDDAHADHLNHFRTTLNSHGVCGGQQSWVENTKYVSSIYWRPVNKPDMVFGGIATNIEGWKVGVTEYLPDGWRRYYRYRDGVGVATKTDQVHHSFYCPSLQLNETIYFDVCCAQTEQGRMYPTAYTPNSRSTKSYLEINCARLTEYTIFGCFVPNSPFKNDQGGYTTTPNQAALIRVEDTQKVGGFYYRYWMSNNANSDPFLDPDGYYNTSSGTGHIHAFYEVANLQPLYFVIRKTGTKVRFRIYQNGWKDEHVMTVPEDAGMDCLKFGDDVIWSGKYRDLSIYSRALSDDEVAKLIGTPLAMAAVGDLVVSRTVERPNGIPADALYIPLGRDGRDTTRLVAPASESNTVYEGGAVWIGTGTTNYVLNPTGRSGARKSTVTGWDQVLHADALIVDNWSFGYNSGLTSPEIGYHGKWVYEGIDGDPCMKFIDRNDLFGLGHRWLGFSENLGTPATLGFTEGTKLVVSWYQKADAAKGARVGIYYWSIADGEYSFGDAIKTTTVSHLNTWERTSLLFTVTADWDLSKPCYLYVYGQTGAYGTLWVDNIQVQKDEFLKPFVASSIGFSDLEYNFHRDYQLDWSGDWSIVYWKMPVGTSTNDLAGYNIESLGCNNNSVGGGYIWWGKRNGADAINNATPAAIDPATYFNHWRMVSLVKNGTVLTIKEWAQDGTVQVRTQTVSTDRPDYFVTQWGYDFKFGWDESNVCNTYYRDLIVLKRALSDAEVAALFRTQLRLYPDRLQAQGCFREARTLT